MKYLVPIDLNGNELQNVKIHKLAVDPITLSEALLWYNTTSHKLKYYDGTNIIILNEIDISGKTDKVTSATEGHFAGLDSNGNLTDSGYGPTDINVTNKTDKIVPATVGNLAGLNATGNLIDSGIAPATVNGKADKVSSATSGNFAGLNASGNLTDSGKKASDFEAADAHIMKTNVAQVMTAALTLKGAPTADLQAATKKYVDDSIPTDKANIVRTSDTFTDGEVIIADGANKDVTGSGILIKSSATALEVSSDTAIPTSKAIAAYVETQLANIANGIIIKGTIGAGGTVTALPTTYNIGWAYRAITAGTYAGKLVTVGDLIVAVTSRSGSGNSDSDWIIMESNQEVMTGATSSANGAIGLVPQPLIADKERFLRGDGTWSDIPVQKLTATNSLLTAVSYVASWTITHNLNTRSVIVDVSQAASPYAQVMCDIEKTTLNTITLKFATSTETGTIAAGTYTVTIV